MLSKLIASINLCFLLIVSCLTQTEQCIKPLQSIQMLPTKFGQLETGTFDFRLASPATRYSWLQVPLKQTHAPDKLDVGLSIIYISNYADQTGLDFSIRPIIKDTYFMALFSINANARWVRTHVYYVASSRMDFRTGFFTVIDNNLLEASPTSKKFRVLKPLLYANTYIPNVKIIPFATISGIKSQQTTFSLKISQSQTQYLNANQSIGITFTLVNNTKPIQVLYVSYFAYLLNGMIAVSKNSPASYNFVLDTISNKTVNTAGIGGMTGINSPNLITLLKGKSLRLLAEVDSSLNSYINSLSASDLDTYKKAFQIVDFGVMISNQNLGALLTLTDVASSGLQALADKRTCFTEDLCKSYNGTMTILKNGSTRCVICSADKVFDSQQQRCVCPVNYIASGDGCLKPNTVCGDQKSNFYRNGTCFQLVKTKDICGGNFLVFDEKQNKCKCDQGYTQAKDSKNNKICVLNCPDISVLNVKTLQCQCPKNQFLIGSVCRACDLLKQWSATVKKCICKSGSTETKNGNCMKCSTFAKLNFEQNRCQCNSGYTGNGIICRPSRLGGGAIIIGTSN